MPPLQLFLNFLSTITVASVSDHFFAIITPFILLTFFGLRWYVLKTARDVKRLEAIGKTASILISKLQATLVSISS